MEPEASLRISLPQPEHMLQAEEGGQRGGVHGQALWRSDHANQSLHPGLEYRCLLSVRRPPGGR